MSENLLIESLIAFCVFMVVYTYLGYGVVVWGLVWLRRRFFSGSRPKRNDNYFPEVTLVVPAYNELDYLPEKLQNCLDQDYPKDRLHLLFVVEGSNDGSAEYLEQFKATIPLLEVIGGSERLGKVEAMNRAMKHVRTPITIFTDANTQLNPEAIRKLANHFQDEEVGAVAGEKRILTMDSESAAGSGEGIYWKYESFLKRMDSELYSIVGAAGELFALRTDLYDWVEPDTLLDDFIISLRIAGRGYRVMYEPNAYAMERPSFSVNEEKKRKVRIATGGFQSIQRLAYLLNILKYGLLSFQYISHRVLRWAVTPFCLPLIWLLNFVLLVKHYSVDPASEGVLLWGGLLVVQTLFYLLAYVGYRLEDRQIRWKVAFVPYYFVFMNWCVILGFIRYLKKNESGIWEKARRAA